MPPPTPRLVDPRAVAIIKKFESLHDGDLKQIGLQPKLCPAGIWTGGWGRALRHPQTGAFLTIKGGDADRRMAHRLCQGLDEAKAEIWLAEDLAAFSIGVESLVRVPVTAGQFGALVSFAYNVGLDIDADTRPEGLGDSTLLRKLNAGDYAGAADEFPKWNRGGGKVLPGLVKRRLEEQRLFRA